MKKTTRKLDLNTQTVRLLTPFALEKVHGGYMQPPETVPLRDVHLRLSAPAVLLRVLFRLVSLIRGHQSVTRSALRWAPFSFSALVPPTGADPGQRFPRACGSPLMARCRIC